MSDLKNCPYCGHEAHVRGSGHITCSQKFCINRQKENDLPMWAKDDWNTRPIEDDLRSDLDFAHGALAATRNKFFDAEAECDKLRAQLKQVAKDTQAANAAFVIEREKLKAQLEAVRKELWPSVALQIPVLIKKAKAERLAEILDPGKGGG